ncbi:hypothetical protein Trydic_g7552 [Trypoxylus dichotomus]
MAVLRGIVDRNYFILDLHLKIHSNQHSGKNYLYSFVQNKAKCVITTSWISRLKKTNIEAAAVALHVVRKITLHHAKRVLIVNPVIQNQNLDPADIGENVRKSDLEKLFSQYGTLKEVWMTNSSPCFGFAVYKDKKSANNALNEADGIEIGGSRIRVTFAKPRTRGSGRRFFNPNMRCYQCGYTGHFYRDCPDLNGGEKRSNSRYDRSSRRHRERRDRDYYYERDYGRRHRRSRRYDDYGSHRSSRRHRY